MGLEVEGSTPSIYPIFSKWSVEINNTKPLIIQMQWAAVYLNLLKVLHYKSLLIAKVYKYSSFLAKTHNLLQTPYLRNVPSNPLYNDFMVNQFKVNYKVPTLIRQSDLVNSKKPIIHTYNSKNIKIMHSFKSYIRINANSLNTIDIPHFSFKHFYLGYKRGGVTVLNISKFFTRWKDVYYLLYNLFFYKIELLTFGTSFFKREILALNWQASRNFKFMWRYTRPFLTLRSNKITTYGDFVFYRLSLLGMKLGFIIDVLYHNKTIYYLHRAGFYTIGLVPVNYNINTLNFAIPSSSDSLVTQIFFIRFMSLIKQNTHQIQYNYMKSLWYSSL